MGSKCYSLRGWRCSKGSLSLCVGLSVWSAAAIVGEEVSAPQALRAVFA